MIDYEKDLNEAQREAVFHGEGALLVIAGAGSGKTRTVTYRLARLVQEGVAPNGILLLTFTRKASQEMLTRAGHLLGHGLAQVSGGTFHSFAYMLLRQNSALLGLENGFTVMDRSDCLDLLGQSKDSLSLGKGDRSFPKKDTVLGFLSKARNKEKDLGEVLQREAGHLLPYAEDLAGMGREYTRLKRAHGLFDYDDLLFVLEQMLVANPELRTRLHERYRHLMVDEYQDTNLVQARLVRLLAGERGNVMAVGDDAQSIYAFRGANVANILSFPTDFPGAAVVRLEENYRSTQPILDLTNAILANAAEKYEKHLFTRRADGARPRLVRTLSDASQNQAVLETVRDLSRRMDLSEIAVLFRAGYQSYGLEVALGKVGVPFQKFGGIRFSEAAHIKDILAYLRLAANVTDMPAWQRLLKHIKGVGGKTALRIFDAVVGGDDKAMARHRKRFPELAELLSLLDSLRAAGGRPAHVLDLALAHYGPVLMRDYPDDYPRRQQGLDQLSRIAAGYADLESFLADMSLENPEEEVRGVRKDHLVLSTIHSAKGLEWRAVILIDLVEDRFPSRKAMARPEDLEEERRLMYVACTRARDELHLFVPESVYLRHLERAEPVRPSPFVLELASECFEAWRESYAGGLTRETAGRPASSPFPVSPEEAAEGRRGKPGRLGNCTHKIYGRGKIIEYIAPNKYRVNFPGFGLKVMIGDYLEMED